MDTSSIVGITAIVVFGLAALIWVLTKFTMDKDRTGPSYAASQIAGIFAGLKAAVTATATGASASGIPQISNALIFPEWLLKAVPIIFFAVLIIMFLSAYIHYKSEYRYHSTPADINAVKSARRTTLSQNILSLPSSNQTLIGVLGTNSAIASGLDANNRALCNFRPLCVQNSGYLGGLHDKDPYADGVYDTDPDGSAIPWSVRVGARAFMFNIDYLDNMPCSPVLVYRDGSGFRRSLNTGSLASALTKLKSEAFQQNTDPVVVIVYFRRVPTSQDQYNKYFRAVALALNTLAPNHLRTTGTDNYTRCAMESELFTKPITEFRNKFIVLTNVNTFDYGLPTIPNPKENLHYYTHARIFADSFANNRRILGDVTQLPPTNVVPRAVVGSISDYLTLKDETLRNFKTNRRGTFVIALRDPQIDMSDNDIGTLLNTCEVQCIPLDVLNLAAKSEHKAVMNNQAAPTTREAYSSAGEIPGDPLSYWRYTGWTPKLAPASDAMAGSSTWYRVPTPQAPAAQNTQANAAGGVPSLV